MNTRENQIWDQFSTMIQSTPLTIEGLQQLMEKLQINNSTILPYQLNKDCILNSDRCNVKSSEIQEDLKGKIEKFIASKKPKRLRSFRKNLKRDITSKGLEIIPFTFENDKETIVQKKLKIIRLFGKNTSTRDEKIPIILEKNKKRIYFKGNWGRLKFIILSIFFFLALIWKSQFKNFIFRTFFLLALISNAIPFWII